MHTLADRDLSDYSIGTSTLFRGLERGDLPWRRSRTTGSPTWSADGRYLESTARGCCASTGAPVWFYDESYVISRRRE